MLGRAEADFSRAAWAKPQEGRAVAQDTAVPSPAQEESKPEVTASGPQAPTLPSSGVAPSAAR